MTTTTAALSIQGKAYKYLRGKILSGELRPGSVLSEASIARELGNSRGPLREAVRQLTAEGFLRPTPRGGSVVVEFSRRDVAELYELREALEVYAVGKAAEQVLGRADLGVFQQVVDDVRLLRDELISSGEPCLHQDGMRRFIRMDLQFHNLIVRAAANARMLKVFADTRVLLNIFAIRRKGHDVAQLTEIHRYHSEILAAVRAGDPKAAKVLLGEHIVVGKLERLKEFDEIERENAMGQPHLEMYSVDLP
jgi:DNA-binding GntR family transcriptional regulator